jgi:hypothetical protein
LSLTHPFCPLWTETEFPVSLASVGIMHKLPHGSSVSWQQYLPLAGSSCSRLASHSQMRELEVKAQLDKEGTMAKTKCPLEPVWSWH